MEVIEILWNSFHVVLPRASDETTGEYNLKAANCLRKFSDTYTTVNPPIDLFWCDPDEHLEKKVAGNFVDMWLNPHCDVKFVVQTETDHFPPGIFVYCHKKADRRPQIAYLRERFKEFEYEEKQDI